MKKSATPKRQLLVMLGVYLFVVGSFNHVQMSSGVQVQGHPGEASVAIGCRPVALSRIDADVRVFRPARSCLRMVSQEPPQPTIAPTAAILAGVHRE